MIALRRRSPATTTSAPSPARATWRSSSRSGSGSQGFIVVDHVHRYPGVPGRGRAAGRRRQLVYRETIVDGFEQLPDAFAGLFRGDNIGKMLVRVGPSSLARGHELRSTVEPRSALAADREVARARRVVGRDGDRSVPARAARRSFASTTAVPSRKIWTRFVVFGSSVSWSSPPAQSYAVTAGVAVDVAVRLEASPRRSPAAAGRSSRHSVSPTRRGPSRLARHRRPDERVGVVRDDVAGRDRQPSVGRDMAICASRIGPGTDSAQDRDDVGRCCGFQNRCCQTIVPAGVVAVVDVGDRSGADGTVDPVRAACRRGSAASASALGRPRSRRPPSSSRAATDDHRNEQRCEPCAARIGRRRAATAAPTATMLAGASPNGRSTSSAMPIVSGSAFDRERRSTAP